MTESLASLLMKNIDLILEAYTVDKQGNLIEANKRKVRESDEVFHDYFVKSMNRMFRQINEADPIMNDPDMMNHPMGRPDHQGVPTKIGSNSPIGTPARLRDQNGGMNSRNNMGMGQDEFGQDEFGQGGFGGQDEFGDDMLGDMAMNDMQAGMGQMNPRMGQMGQMGDQYGDQMGMEQMGEEDPYAPDNLNAMGNDQSMGMDGGMGGGAMGGGMGGGGAAMESANFDWVFNEESDLDVDSLFNITEEDDDDDEDDDDQLNEFMDDMHDPDEQMGMHGGGMHGGGMGGGMGGGGMDMGGAMGGGMDMGGGQNDFGGDMNGGGDMMGGGDMGGGMGGDEEMVTIHGTTDGGGEFEFSFDPSTLGFGGEDEMGGDEFGGGEEGGEEPDFGGGEEEGGEEPDFGGGGGDEHHFGGGDEEEDENPVHEAASRKPGKGKRGVRTAKMAVVPKNPAAGGAVPFPTAQGQRQKRK